MVVKSVADRYVKARDVKARDVSKEARLVVFSKVSEQCAVTFLNDEVKP